MKTKSANKPVNKLSQVKALQLLSRFSLPPNSLGYCGKGSATEKFKDCIINGNCKDIKKEISHFIVLYPYLKTISKLSGLSVFDYKVAECFWLGNNLIKKAKVADYNLLLKNLHRQGVPESFVDELRQKQPLKFIPFHLFQVLHVGVGKSSGAVPFNLVSINNCMIRWGKVTKINKNKMRVNLVSLKIVKKKYVLYKKSLEYAYNPGFLKGVKIGDYVSVHWGIINKILIKTEVKNLEFWSEKVLNNLIY